MMPETKRPLLGISALTGNVYVLMRNGTKREVPEAELVTVISEWLDTHDLVVKKNGFRVRYGVEEILPLEPTDFAPEQEPVGRIPDLMAELEASLEKSKNRTGGEADDHD